MIDPDADPPRDPFGLALDEYRARFGDTVTVVGIRSDRYGEIATLFRVAVASGRSLSDGELRRALGLDPLPDGVEV